MSGIGAPVRGTVAPTVVPPVRGTVAPTVRGTIRSAFTLMELVVSMSIAVVLLGGIASAIVVAGHAIPGRDNGAAALIDAVDVVDRIAGELLSAQTLPVRSPSTVEFTLPDRNADLAPETVRYVWSGVVGDPLTRQYNAGPQVALSDGLADFKLTYTVRPGPSPESPRVLFVLRDLTKSGRIDKKKAAMQSWGFTVQLIDDDAVDADLTAAITANDVIYIDRKANASGFGSRIRGVTRGLVTERGSTYADLGIAQTSAVYLDDLIQIVDNTHDITAGLPIASLTILSSGWDRLVITAGTNAAGGRVLATDRGAGPTLMTIEIGDSLYGGGEAAARRVKLPWGGSGFAFDKINNAGLELMRKSIIWAAAPPTCTAIRIQLQAALDSSERVETQVQILNRPEL